MEQKKATRTLPTFSTLEYKTCTIMSLTQRRQEQTNKYYMQQNYYMYTPCYQPHCLEILIDQQFEELNLNLLISQLKQSNHHWNQFQVSSQEVNMQLESKRIYGRKKKINNKLKTIFSLWSS